MLEESLDFRWANLPHCPFGGRDHEKEVVNVKEGSMAVELFSRRQANAQGVSGHCAVCEVIGECDVGRPCRVSHRVEVNGFP